MHQPDNAQFLPATRRDGWSPALKGAFLDRLAARGNVRLACAAVGMSREAAYRLRRHEPLFARGWDAALAIAREASVQVLADRAIDGVEEQIYYRGELIGTRRKYDTRLLLAHLARLDKLVEAVPVTADVERFEELLAIVAGEPVPEELPGEPGELPPDRAACAELARAIATECAFAELDARQEAAAEQERLEDDALAAAESMCLAVGEQARAEAEAAWDAWRARACAVVDRLVDGCDRFAPSTLSILSTSPLPACRGEADD